MKTKKKASSRKTKAINSDAQLNQLWLEWQVAKDPQDESFVSFDFSITKRNDTLNYQKVAIPVLALYHLAEKYNWLQVLRGPDHRPQDPYELVRFVKMLEEL